MWGLNALIANPLVGRDLDLSSFFDDEVMDDGFCKLNDPLKTWWVDVDELDHAVYHPEMELCDHIEEEEEDDVEGVLGDDYESMDFYSDDNWSISDIPAPYEDYDVIDIQRVSPWRAVLNAVPWDSRKECISIRERVNGVGDKVYIWKMPALNWALHGVKKPHYKNHRRSQVKRIT